VSDGFEYGNARVRARRAELFGRGEYQGLIALDTDRLLAALSDTPFRPDLVAATPRFRGMRLFEEAVRTNLARNLRDLVTWYEGAAATQVAPIVGRWDLRNIRTILRGHYARADRDEIRAALIPAGALGDEELGELAGQSGLRPAVELMVSWGVPTPATARAVAAALVSFETSADFQALERAMDQVAADRLRHALIDAEPEVAHILRAEIDRANLLTALRLHRAAVEEEEWDTADPRERFLPGGVLPAATLAAATRAPDRAGAVAMIIETPLDARWRPALERWQESGSLVALGDELDEALTRTAVGMFATADPLGPGIPLAYVWAKENEVKNLRTIGSALAAGVAPDAIEEQLVMMP
jgi:V/A-type H+-transporting ATPase subunit C